MLGLGLGLQKSTKLGGFIGLLDLFPGAAAAYSLRKLRSAYSGSAVRVRKEVSSVSSETDIGFAADGSLDTVSLLAFASDADSGDVFVVTWYDQSLSNNATQSTAAAQPKIVSGGAVITEGTSAKPAIDFDVSGIYLATSAIPEVTQPATHIATLKYTSGETSEIPFSSLSDVNGRNLSYKGNSNYAMFAGSVFESATAVTNDQQLNFSLFNGASSSMWKDGTLIIDNESVGTETIEGITIGSDHDANPDFFGKIQEYMVYASDQSSNRTAIETNINTFYSIYP